MRKSRNIRGGKKTKGDGKPTQENTTCHWGRKTSITFLNDKRNHRDQGADNIRQKKTSNTEANVTGSRQADWCLKEQC